MREKGEEDNTQQKALLIYKILPFTCVLILTQLTCVFVLIPTQLTCVLVHSSLMQPSPEPTRLPRSRHPERWPVPERGAVPAGEPSYAPRRAEAFQNEVPPANLPNAGIKQPNPNLPNAETQTFLTPRPKPS